MSIKELIACNKDPKTKKVFKDAEGLIRRLTQLGFNDPKIKVGGGKLFQSNLLTEVFWTDEL